MSTQSTGPTENLNRMLEDWQARIVAKSEARELREQQIERGQR